MPQPSIQIRFVLGGLEIMSASPAFGKKENPALVAKKIRG
jgi:hypothetical protein